MNKRMRELQAAILAKSQEAQTLLDAKDMTKATAVLDELDELQKAFDLEERLFNARKGVAEDAAPAEPQAKPDSVKAFARAARHGFKTMDEGAAVEGVSDGGYTVPEDIQTQINTYRSAKRSLLDLVTVVPVQTMSGARTFKKRAQQTGFAKVGEATAIPGKATPQFTRLAYTIDKYAGYFPVTSELLQDSDANIVNEITAWAGDESRVTANKLILAAVATKTQTDLAGLDDIKKALNVTLGQAFKATSVVVTNDDGLQFLDTLKDGDGEYLLQRSPAEPMRLVLCAGATTVPIEVIPNADLASEEIYKSAATDSELIDGVTYYTRSGSGTAESPYVYAAVASPDVAAIATYYKKFAGIPMIIGDLKEGVVFWDRQRMTLMQSNTAVVGSSASYLNAFEEDLLLIRAIEREDVTLRDSEAFVNGKIEVLA